MSPAPAASPAMSSRVVTSRSAAAAPEPPRAPVTVAEYYAPAQGRRGVALLRALHDVSEDHHRERSYIAARSAMFGTIEDLDGDDVVIDVYSGQRVPGVVGLRSATRAGLTTEHVWPQSEGATEAARSDLHHLRPTLQGLNSHRSNLPFGDVIDPDWASEAVDGVGELSVVGSDASGTRVFMPRASVRGDLARDQLYFVTRYHGGDRPSGYSTDNFAHSLPTLLRWNADDPVDDAERARNEAVFRLQGNRNPYVDRPGFVDDVGFSQRLVRVHLAQPAAG